MELLKGYTGDLYFYDGNWYDYVWQQTSPNETAINVESGLLKQKLYNYVKCSDIKVLKKRDIELFVLPVLENPIRWNGGYIKPHTVVCDHNNAWLINGYHLADILNCLKQYEITSESNTLLTTCHEFLKDWE